MPAMRRKILVAVGATLSLFLVLAILGPLFFKGQIRDAVLDAAGGQLTADLAVGDVSLSLLRSFPSASVRLADVAITGRDQHEGTTLLELDQLDFSVNLSSLLGGPIGIERIEIDSPSVHLVRGEDGVPNWEITKPGDAPKEGGGASPELALERVSIRDGSFTLEDAASGLSVTIDELAFDGRGDLGAMASEADAKLVIGALGLGKDGRSYLEDSRLEIDLLADIDQATGLLTLRENRIQLDELQVGGKGTVTLPASGPNVLDLTFEADTPSIASLISLVPGLADGALDGMTTDGVLSLTGFVKGAAGDALPTFGVDLTVRDGIYSHAALAEPVTDIQVDLHVDSPGPELDDLVADLKRLHAKLAGNPLTAVARLSKPVSEVLVDLEARGDLDLAQLGALIPREQAAALAGQLNLDITYSGSVLRLSEDGYMAAKATGRVDLKDVTYQPAGAKLAVVVPVLAMEVTPSHMEVEQLRLTAGRSDLQGSGRLDNALGWAMLGEDLTGALKTTSGRVDLDELMASFGGEPGGPISTQPQSQENPKEPLRLPRGIDVGLDSQVKELTFSGMAMNNAQLQVRVVDQTLRIEQIGVDLLGGRVELDGLYDSRPLQPLADLGVDLSRIDVAKAMESFPVLTKLAPVARRAVGKVSTEFKLLTSLDESMSIILDSLSGQGELVAHSLKIEGSEALESIGKALKSARFDQATLDGASAYFEVKNGAVNVKPFALALGPIQATFGGTHQFDQDIDYDMDLEIPAREFSGAASSALTNLTKGTPFAGSSLNLSDTVSVGVDIGGTVAKPIVTLDMKSLGASAGEVLESVVEQVAEKLVEVADKALDTAREQAEAALATARQQAEAAKTRAYKLADQAKRQGYAAADELVADAKDPIAKLAAQAALNGAKQQTDRGLRDAKRKADAEYTTSMKNANAEYDKSLAKAKQGVKDAPTAVKKSRKRRKK